MLKHQVDSQSDLWAEIKKLRINGTQFLAPKMKIAVEKSVFECNQKHVWIDGVAYDLDVVVEETQRTNALQRIYYNLGTTRAITARHSWHFFGLAVDVISKRFEWFTGEEAIKIWPDLHAREAACFAWFEAVAKIFKANGMEWGGDWKMKDLPHFQWGTLKASPSELAQELYDKGGLKAVWEEVEAA